MTSELKPLAEEEIFQPAIAIIHGWLALLRDNTEVPGQILEDQAIFLIREFKKYLRDTQESYQTGKDDGQKIAKREVIEKVEKFLGNPDRWDDEEGDYTYTLENIRAFIKSLKEQP
jgi:hypothetical protein